MTHGLTLSEIQNAGNKIVSQDIESGRVVTLYGQSTYNVWQSYDSGGTFVNVKCYTA